MTIKPSVCVYCARDEHHLCRPDVTPCSCDNARCHPAPATDFGDDPWLFNSASNQHVAEFRADRPYDEANPATIYHPHGHVESFDRAFCGAATKAVLDLYAELRSA